MKRTPEELCACRHSKSEHGRGHPLLYGPVPKNLEEGIRNNHGACTHRNCDCQHFLWVRDVTRGNSKAPKIDDGDLTQEAIEELNRREAILDLIAS